MSGLLIKHFYGKFYAYKNQKGKAVGHVFDTDNEGDGELLNSDHFYVSTQHALDEDNEGLLVFLKPDQGKCYAAVEQEKPINKGDVRKPTPIKRGKKSESKTKGNDGVLPIVSPAKDKDIAF